MSTYSPETVYALSTPPGVGALAVVRLSGPGVPQALAALGVTPLPAPRVATLATLTYHGAILDRALVTFFKGPHSFTGEDVAELSLHGGRAVVAGVLQALADIPGLRLAEPGEFTERAFLNHKLDLTEAEAVADLIHAETVLQRRQALAQLGGSLKTLYDGWRDDLIRVAAYLEAHLDFPDEDLPSDLYDRVRGPVQTLQTAIENYLDDGGCGERLRDGFQVVILGAPNAGKSSLFNTLARRDVAIVSNVPGTTRDVLDVHLDLKGIPVTLADTAGLRVAASDEHGQIEQMGMDRARRRAAQADLKILLVDGTLPPDPSFTALIDDQSLVVVNKIDLLSGQKPGPGIWQGYPALFLSIQTEEGIPDLITALTDRLSARVGGPDSAPLTRARHREALMAAVSALHRAVPTPPLPPELMAEELRSAIQALGRLTGRIDVEDLLDVIFRDFCIGK